MQIIATSFTGMQLALITIIAVICVALLAANAVLLVLFFRKKKKRKLCNAALQERREKLLEELYDLRFVTDARASEESEDEEGEEIVVDIAERGEKILAVRNMSQLMRQKFGFEGDEYNLKQYYVRNTYGFEAKLRACDDLVKERYKEISNEIRKLSGLNVSRSFKAERVYAGRKTLAMLLFRGKTLCIAFALDPKVYEDTKYRGKDVSEVKRFAATPLLYKLTSPRRVAYAKYLVGELAAQNSLVPGVDEYRGIYDLSPRTYRKLFALGLLKIRIVGEAADIEEDLFEDDFEEEIAATDNGARARVVAVADMSVYMRQKLGLVGKEYDKRSYFLRYNYGFEAKLRASSDEIKERCKAIIDEAGWYKNLSVNFGFRGVRFSYGRKTVAQLLFRGKTLCIALALNPKDYEDTKYKGVDVSSVKRFAKTPMLYKLTSLRKLGYTKYLLNRIAEECAMEMNETQLVRELDSATLTADEMLSRGLVKIVVAGEANLAETAGENAR